METLTNSLLTIHIIGGVTGLLAGTINLIQRKGDRKHKRMGRLFVYGMCTAGFSALILSVLRPNPFLFAVGIFTLYMTGSGFRYIYLKLLGHSQKPVPMDWIISVLMLIAGIAFVGMGTMNMMNQNMFGMVFIVFGIIGLRFVKADIDHYRSPKAEKNYWLLMHLQRMCGSYIAATTAFLVVNLHYVPVEVPGVLAWLLPTVIITPLIVRWSGKYRAGMAK